MIHFEYSRYKLEQLFKQLHDQKKIQTWLYIFTLTVQTNFKYFLKQCFKTIFPGSEFIENQCTNILCDAFETTHQSEEIRRLIVNLPPRHFKSFIINSVGSAYMLGKDPSMDVMSVSHTQALAEAHGRSAKRIMESEWYQRAFPQTRIAKDQNTKSFMATTMGGSRLSTSMDGSVTGKGADVIIIDDGETVQQANNRKAREKIHANYSQAIYSRLNNKKTGKIINISQRLHEADLSGKMLRNKDDSVLHINLPAIAQEDINLDFSKYGIVPGKYKIKKGDLLDPEREPLEVLNRIEFEMGEGPFAAQYLQSPSSDKGKIIHKKWFRFYNHHQVEFTDEDETYFSIDPAIKTGEENDFSVIQVWTDKNGRFYLRDCFRDRVNFTDLKKEIYKLAEFYNPQLVLIEKCPNGSALYDDLENNSNLPLEEVPVVGDKATRLNKISMYIRGAMVFIPEDDYFTIPLMDEVSEFPHAKHDDMVDALSQFLNFVDDYQEDDTPPKIGPVSYFFP